MEIIPGYCYNKLLCNVTFILSSRGMTPPISLVPGGIFMNFKPTIKRAALPFLVLAAGGMGLTLRVMLYTLGLDVRGLLPRYHISSSSTFLPRIYDISFFSWAKTGLQTPVVDNGLVAVPQRGHISFFMIGILQCGHQKTGVTILFSFH